MQIILSGYVEPWTDPECTAMVLHTLMKGYKCSIFTTLQGMDPKDTDMIVEQLRERDDQLLHQYVCIFTDNDMFMRGWKNEELYFIVLDKFINFFTANGWINVTVFILRLWINMALLVLPLWKDIMAYSWEDSTHGIEQPH